MPLGKEVGLSPGHIVLDGDPAPHSSPSPLFGPCLGSPISATAELLFCLFTTTTVLRPFFPDHQGEPVPEENVLGFVVQRIINRGRHTDHSVYLPSL